MAPSTRLTLAEAAERLGVHYMTAYRYVRLGTLPATKDDGTWRLELADVDAFRREQESHPAAGRRGSPRFDEYRLRLHARLVAGDDAGAWAVVERARAAGASPRDVHLEVLAPTMRAIGDGWAAGDLSIAAEHRASAAAARLAGRLAPAFARRGRTRGTVVVGAVAGDPHGLPAQLLADVLRGEGYAVTDLGANTPADSFIEAAVAADRLVAVCVSVSSPDRDRTTRSAVRALRAVVPDTPVFVGGPAIATEGKALRLGASAWAADAIGVAALLGDEREGS